MKRRRRLRATIGATAALAVVAVVGATYGSAAPARSSGETDSIVVGLGDLLEGAVPAGDIQVSLISGDQVSLGFDTDGNPAVNNITEAPRDHGGTVVFHRFVNEGRLYVVPEDALSLLAEDVLDWELFNVVKLVELAQAGTTDEIPVIVTSQQPVAARRALSAEGVSVSATLESIEGVAATIEADGSWWQNVQKNASAGSGSAAARTPDPLADIEKVWLDELLEISLEQSVPQVGAPVAWGAGVDGSGVTVAVLDTGIDTSHPDLAGKVIDEVDFTANSAGPRDGHGHGTHVASTIAGTGAASGGQYTGVAPGAQLISGKVCGDNGSCPFSSIIAGMEWAAESGARVVNMSLGGPASDGTDPLSQALNHLSVEHGTLFVTSAGNSGPNAETVGRPAAADEALAVAAVDKAGEMASFSSRGPRLGDGAPKPDIAAPGVDIGAARAQGTSMGTPINARYTTASGTSMSSPHVAGGAAIVAQQYPELDGRELKALLMGTASDLGHDMHAQGAGLLDLARAIDPDVYSNGNVAFGRLPFRHGPVTDTITYTNATDEPITLTLTLDASLTAFDGTPAHGGMLQLDADQVTVPANGTAHVSAILDADVVDADGPYGPYSGAITATDASGELRATLRVSAFVEPERFEVNVEVIPPEGATDMTYGSWTIVPMDEKVHLHDGPLTFSSAPSVTTGLFEGDYSISTTVRWTDAHGDQHLALPVAPQVHVTDDKTDMTLRLDLREAKQVKVEVPEPTETLDAWFGYDRASATGAWETSVNARDGYHGGDPNWWVLPTDPVTVGTFGSSHQHVLSPPLVTMRALGSGSLLNLSPRYHRAGGTVGTGNHSWLREECDDIPILCQESVSIYVPIPKLDGVRVVPVVHAGTGSGEELDGVDLDGALVLLTPTDICPDDCDFAALRERVSDAADTGAVGVLVAGDTSRSSLLGNDLEIQQLNRETCPDGPDSCPPVKPLWPVPVLGLPTAEADQLVEQLAHRPVRIRYAGETQVPRAYTLAYAYPGEVPGDVAHRLGSTDLYRVDHRFHSDRPDEVSTFFWRRFTEATQNLERELLLPSIATQRELPVFVGPLDGEVIHEFEVRTVGFSSPFIKDFTSRRTGVQQYVFDDADRHAEIAWNLRPTVPGTAVVPTTASGFAPPVFAVCSGCRHGDMFNPIMYLTTGSTHPTAVIGLLNDRRLASALTGLTGSCEPSICEVHLYDDDGNELPQRLIPITGSPITGKPSSFDGRETNR